MFKDRKSGSTGNTYGKKFMAKPAWNKGPRDRFSSDRPSRFGADKPMMHSATCAQCGEGCQVPFKPNGKKPILCSMCFKKDGGNAGSDRPNRFSSDRPARFGSSRPEGGSGGSAMTSDQFRTLNEKLDLIIEALSD